MESGGPSSGSIGSLDHKKPASIGRGMLAKKASINNSREFAVLAELLRKQMSHKFVML